MLRITTFPDDPAATLRLEGHIAGPWIEPFRAACAEVLREGGGLTLDLGEVALIDRPALALLIELAAQGVTFTRCSSFHTEQLRSALAAR
jgi:hypothetical protein